MKTRWWDLREDGQRATSPRLMTAPAESEVAHFLSVKGTKDVGAWVQVTATQAGEVRLSSGGRGETSIRPKADEGVQP